MMAQGQYDNLFRQVAGRIRELRKARGLTQESVYVDTGLNIGRIEVGAKGITLTTIAILCEYFEISLGEFFNGLDNLCQQ